MGSRRLCHGENTSLFMIFPNTLSYNLTARSNCIAVCSSTWNQQDIQLCVCFSIVIALDETETMHWAPVFQIVLSGDYGKVYLSFKKERSVQADSRNN